MGKKELFWFVAWFFYWQLVKLSRQKRQNQCLQSQVHQLARLKSLRP